MNRSTLSRVGALGLNRAELRIVATACALAAALVGGVVVLSDEQDAVATTAPSTTIEVPATTSVAPTTSSTTSSTTAPTTTTTAPPATTTTTAAPRESSGGQTPAPTPVAPVVTEPPSTTVPDTRVTIASMIGQDVDLARSTFEGEGFVVAVDVTCTGAAGNSVLTQTPADTLVEPGSAVAMTAEGSDCVQVPNVVGSLADKAHCFSQCDYAIDLFSAVGLTSYSEGGTRGSNCGVITSQTPAAGTWVRSSEPVTAIESGSAIACLG